MTLVSIQTRRGERFLPGHIAQSFTSDYFMKQFFSVVAAIVCAAACNHVNDSNICIIEGNMSGLEGDGWIYMTDMWNDSGIIGSVEYHDGVFRFEVCADEPTKVFLHAGCFRAFNFTCYRSDDD